MQKDLGIDFVDLVMIHGIGIFSITVDEMQQACSHFNQTLEIGRFNSA